METVRLATTAMGCRWEFALAGSDPVALRAAGEEAIEEVASAHARLSAFAGDSVVTRINAGAGVHFERVDAEVLELLSACESVRVATDGAFDVCVGRVMEARGYTRSPAGSSTTLEATVGRLVIDASASTVGLAEAGSAVDLGGVGKGFGLDLAVACLREFGVASAFVHAGTSSMAAIGRRHDGARWRVGLPGGGEVELEDSAMSVSGTEVQGGHVLDPRTGEPALERGAVAVRGPSAALCDAWSTACLVDSVNAGRLPGGYVCLEEAKAWTV